MNFYNHYDLASYLLGHATALVEGPISNAEVGRVDILFDLLQRLNMATSQNVEKYFNDLHGDLERRPLADQIVDALLDEDPQRLVDLRVVQLRGGMVGVSTEDQILRETGAFLVLWNELERLVREGLGADAPSTMNLGTIFVRARKSGFLTEEEYRELALVRRFRNELVHGAVDADVTQLQRQMARLVTLVDIVRRKRDATHRHD